jgi:hypothetical protein
MFEALLLSLIGALGALKTAPGIVGEVVTGIETAAAALEAALAAHRQAQTAVDPAQLHQEAPFVPATAEAPVIPVASTEGEPLNLNPLPPGAPPAFVPGK